MIMGEKGCEYGTSGIGDIAYVKDLQTEEIVSTTFRCSEFGFGHRQQPSIKIGWVSKINKYIRQINKNLYVKNLYDKNVYVRLYVILLKINKNLNMFY